jgi:hypothetical protein
MMPCLFEEPDVDQHARNPPVRLSGFRIASERAAEFLDREFVLEALRVRPEQVTPR